MGIADLVPPTRSVARSASIAHAGLTARAVVAGTPPASPADPLYVYLPDVSQTDLVGPCKWNADKGLTLPAAGASALVMWDNLGAPYVVWWAADSPRTLVEGVDYELVNGAAPRADGQGIFTVTRLGDTVGLFGALKHVPADGTPFVHFITLTVDPSKGSGWLPVAYREDSSGSTFGAIQPKVSMWSGDNLTFYNEDSTLSETHYEVWFGGQSFLIL